MPEAPSRRNVLAVAAGAAVGFGGGYVVGSVRDGAGNDASTSRQIPRPFAWTETDWPFRGYDPARTRHPPAASAPDGRLAIAWTAEVNQLTTPPVVANGRLLIADALPHDVRIRALDRRTGSLDWEAAITGDGSGQPERYRPDLAAIGGGVYYSVPRAEDAPLGLLSGTTGDGVWSIPDPPAGSWLIGGGRLFHANRTEGSLRAYDARTGEELWSGVGIDEESLSVESFRRSVGLFARGDVSGRLNLLDPSTGAVTWERSVPTHVKSGPVVTNRHAYVTKWSDGMDLLALDLESGETQWQYPLSPTVVDSSSGGIARRWYELDAATPNVLVVSERRADPSPGRLHAVEAASGERRWRIAPPDGATGFFGATVVDDEVFAVVGGDDRDALLRLDLDDGRQRETVPLSGSVFHGPVVAGGRVVVGTQDEVLVLD